MNVIIRTKNIGYDDSKGFQEFFISNHLFFILLRKSKNEMVKGITMNYVLMSVNSKEFRAIDKRSN